MERWTSAADCIRQRSASSVIQSIEVETPFAFDSVTAGSSEVADFIDSQFDELAANSVIDFPGRDVSFTQDLLMSITKFFHVVDCARSNFRRGAWTWTFVDAYHAALLGGRAMCSFYGVLHYTVRGRTVLIDFRPEFGRLDDMKKFQRDHRGLEPRYEY